MTSASAKPRALISVSDKKGLAAFARGLDRLGFEIVSTGGTAQALQKEGLSVIEVEEVTGFPEMLEGRVKTLHPKIHAGILARRARVEDREALRRHEIALVDLVVVNLYPFAETAAKPDVSFAEVVENIDIGGPSLLRAAAKNFQDVLVVCDPADYEAVLDGLQDSTPSEALRYRLMRKVFAHTASYDAAIAAYFGARPDPSAPPEALSEFLGIAAERRDELRYGENPHQKAAWYAPSRSSYGPWLARATVLQGKELSYNNLLDLHSAAACLRDLSSLGSSGAVVVKHNTPCGVAVSSQSIAEAYEKARRADETSAFGGIVALDAVVDGAAAKVLAETFLEAVIAPGFDEEARAVLGAKKNLRLLELSTLSRSVAPPWIAPLEVRSIGDGFLVQESDVLPDDPQSFKVVTKRPPTPEEMQALRFGWAVVKHVRSNAIVFAASDRSLAIGGGQTSRVEAVELAARKGAGRLAESAVASDAFFPFRDGLDAAVHAGARAVIQPGGSVRDAEVIAAADEQGVAMVFTGRRHFRH
jgi:phosphoribosylaminoimidazolecarboxamide formyltransferase/IMP cyclohydrolase